jgi:hypothetical protein
VQEQLILEGLELVCAVCDAELEVQEEDEAGVEESRGGLLLTALPHLLPSIIKGKQSSQLKNPIL